MPTAAGGKDVFHLLLIYAAFSSGLSLLLALLGAALSRLSTSITTPAIVEWFSTASVASGWFCTSVTFTLFNKFFMQLWRGGFQYPILTTTVHMFLKVMLTRIWYCFNMTRLFPVSGLPQVGWIVFARLIVPIGVLTALDVALSNLGILYAPISIYTAVKASVPVFIFIFGVALGTETFSMPVFLSLCGITAGLGAAILSSANVTSLGIWLCIFAAAAGGLRWALTELLMRTDEASSQHIMVLLYRFSPVSAVAMLPLVIFLELPIFLRKEGEGSIPHSLLEQAAVISIGGGLISFVLIALELILVARTSSLALGVLGTLKEVLQIALGLFIFRENMSLTTGCGLFVAVGSGLVYRHYNNLRRGLVESSNSEETDKFLVELN